MKCKRFVITHECQHFPKFDSINISFLSAKKIVSGLNFRHTSVMIKIIFDKVSILYFIKCKIR